MLIWNTRRTGGAPFLTAYEAFLRRWGTDHRQVSRRYEVEGSLKSFFGSGGYSTCSFVNLQDLDFTGLEGRLLSSSYVPAAQHPRYAPMLTALRELFDAHQHHGRVRIEYDTDVYFGKLD